MQIILEKGCTYLPLSYACKNHPEIVNEHEILLLPGHRFAVKKLTSEGLLVRAWSAWELIER